MSNPIHTLADVRLVGFTPAFDKDMAPRFSVIITAEQAEHVNALRPSRLVKPSLRGDGLIWLTGRSSALPIYRDAPNPWGETFPFQTRGDVAFRIYDTFHPRTGPLRIVGFLGIRITRYPTWDEFMTDAETRP